jgi:hypothetical protein
VALLSWCAELLAQVTGSQTRTVPA